MVEMLLQVYKTTATELSVHIVTEQNGILLVLMNYKCCYLTCKKITTSSQSHQPIPNYL